MEKLLDYIADINTRIKILFCFFLLVILPAAICLFLQHNYPSEHLAPMVGIYLAVVIIIQFPLCNFMSELLVHRNLSKFNAYCQSVKQGRYHSGFNLPPENGKEHDFIQAKRNLYWMGHSLASREKKLFAAMDNLKTAQMKIMESIEYASSIQHALLPPAAAMEAAFPDHFIWWAPRDVVGGDSYWTCEEGGRYFIALIDCTGHGVPGAFMTLIVHALLDQCLQVDGDNDPAWLLSEMNRNLKAFLHRSDASIPIDDGFDAAICRIDPSENRLVFAGAGLPLYFESGEDIREIRGDRAGVGDRHTADGDAFTNHVLDLTGITKIYLATDGLTDQVGGESHLPFGRKRFKRVLHEIRTMPLSRQRQALSDTWHDHVGGEEIRDDLTVLGFSLTHLNKPVSSFLETRETA